MDKIQELADLVGMDVEEMLSEATFDSVAWGICTNPGCDETAQVEPDCRAGYCGQCDSQTIQSCLVLMGMI